jgi:hypothetical protein
MKTEILVITDRSGSTANISGDIVGGFNRFLEDQKKIPGKALMTYTQFDTLHETLYTGRPLQDVEPLRPEQHQPRGGTALLDAIGLTLETQGARIAKENWAELVVVCILTDGRENASQLYTRERIREMIAHAEAHDWKFVYVGANQDAFEVSRGLGMVRGQSFTYAADSQGTHDAYVHTCSTVSAYRSGQQVPDQKAPA